MKMRVFRDMDNAVYRIVIDTEDWSQGDLELMERFGEPEVNVGGEVQYILDGEVGVESSEGVNSKVFGDEYVRVMHGFPYSRGFDSRDYDSHEEAVAVGIAWKEMVLERICNAVTDLRSKVAPLPTEEVSEV